MKLPVGPLLLLKRYTRYYSTRYYYRVLFTSCKQFLLFFIILSPLSLSRSHLSSLRLTVVNIRNTSSRSSFAIANIQNPLAQNESYHILTWVNIVCNCSFLDPQLNQLQHPSSDTHYTQNTHPSTT